MDSKFKANKGDLGASRFLGIAVLFYSVVSVVVLILGCVLVQYIPNMFGIGLDSDELMLTKKLMRITVINVAVTLASNPFVNTIVGYEKFAISKTIASLQILLRALLYVLFLEFGFGSVGLVCAQLIVTFIGRGVSIVYVILKIRLKPLFGGYNKSFTNEVIKYAFLIFIIMISTEINNSLDNVLLAAFVPKASTLIATYSIALQIAYYYNVLGDGMNGVLMPGVVRLIEKESDESAVLCEMIRLGR